MRTNTSNHLKKKKLQYFPYVKYAWNEILISVKCIKKSIGPGTIFLAGWYEVIPPF